MLNDPIVYVRAMHFAATIVAAGVALFVVLIAEPALRNADKPERLTGIVRPRLAWIAWSSLALAVLSGAAWLVLTAQSMSGEPLGDVLTGGVLWTVLSRTDFGNDWLVRSVLACLLAATFVPLLSARGMASRRTKAAAALAAAALVGSLAFAGHAIGGQGIEGIVHPMADVLHLVAAAAWLGALVPLAIFLDTAGKDRDWLEGARTATLRFSTLGIASVATIFATGGINAWYLVGGIEALVGTDYGRLLLAKVALFLVMVGIATVNRLRLTPRLMSDRDIAAAQRALRQLRANAVIEATAGAAIVGIVAVLGILPPASHAHHHAAAGAIPADAFFQHIHTEQGMADVTVEPGHVGLARITIHLWDGEENELDAQQVRVTLTPRAAGGKPITRPASLGADGQWHIDGIDFRQPGVWTVAIDAVLGPGKRLQLAAPIEIDAK
jgi:copper resistance protein D